MPRPSKQLSPLPTGDLGPEAIMPWLEAGDPMWREAEIIYPGAQVRWYPHVLQDHPSLGDDLGSPRMARPELPPQRPERDGGGSLAVCLAKLLVLAPRGAAEGCRLRAAAYYPGEGQASSAPSTKPLHAGRSARSARLLECEPQARLELPFTGLQQLVKLAVYKVADDGEELLGEATVPIADPAAAEEGAWPLLRNLEAMGEVRLSVATMTSSVPSSSPPASSEPASSEPAFFTPASSVAAAATPPAVTPLASLCSGVGNSLEVYSRSKEEWLRCQVAEVQGRRATLVSGGLRRRIDVSDSKLQDYVRPAPSAASRARAGGA